MTQLEDLNRQIDALSEEERLRLVEQLNRRLSKNSMTAARGIESDPEICGGEPRIVRTRIPVWVLEQMRRMGISEAEILTSYPPLRAEDLVNAWNYVDLHRDDIDQQIRENEDA